MLSHLKKLKTGYLDKFPFWWLERPDNLNVADEDDQVGNEGADDEDHLDKGDAWLELRKSSAYPKGEQKWPQVNSRKWNISATDGSKWNPFFVLETFLESKGMWRKKTALRHVFPSILVSTNRDWVYILEPKNEIFDTPLIVDILYFEQTTKNEIK